MKTLSTIFNLGIPSNWSANFFNWTIFDSINQNPIAAVTVAIMVIFAVFVVISAFIGVLQKQS